MVVEDGQGLSNADSYVDIVFADSYMQSIGFTEWATLDDPEKESTLIGASVFTDGRWGALLGNEPVNPIQAMILPQKKLYGPVDAPIPTLFKRGVCEYAVLAVKGVLYTDAGSKTAGGSNQAPIKRKKVQAGPVTTETEYAVSADNNTTVIPGQEIHIKAEAYIKRFIPAGRLGTSSFRRVIL